MDIENAELQKISELPAASTFSGLYTIGVQPVNGQDKSVKVPLGAVISPPYIGENGHWYIWSMSAGNYVDSGYVAKGATGQSAYDYAVEVLHFDGTIEEWYESMKGAPFTYADFTEEQLAALHGKSAYQQAVEGGYHGTEAQFNAMLAGLDSKHVVLTESAYEALVVKDPSKIYMTYEDE